MTINEINESWYFINLMQDFFLHYSCNCWNFSVLKNLKKTLQMIILWIFSILQEKITKIRKFTLFYLSDLCITNSTIFILLYICYCYIILQIVLNYLLFLKLLINIVKFFLMNTSLLAVGKNQLFHKVTN